MNRLLLYCVGLVMLLVGCGKHTPDNSVMLVDSLYKQGRYFLAVHCYDSALNCFAQAEESFDVNTPMRYKGKIYANLASLHKDAAVYDVAMDYAKQALRTYELIGDTACVMLSWVDIADIYIKMGAEDRFQYAQMCYDKSLSYFDTYHNDTIKGRIYQEKGIKYVVANNLDSGLYCLYQSLSLPAQGNAFSIRNLYMAVAYQKMGKLDSAKHYVDVVLQSPNGIRQRSGCYNVLLNVARAEKDTLAMSHYANILVTYKDSILHLENQTAREVVKLNNSSHESIIKKQVRVYVWWGVACVCLLIIVFLVVFLIHRKRTGSIDAYLTRTVEALQLKLAEEENRKEQERKAMEGQLVTLKQSVDEYGMKPFEQWKGLKQDATYRYFYVLMDKLYLSFPFLTERELQICLLVLMRLSNEEMSKILFLSPNSIGKTKQRVAQRLGTSTAHLREFLLQYTT